MLRADGSAAPPVGAPAWYAWLNDEQTVSFAYRSACGGFTTRRERQRNAWYWYACRRIGGKLYKRYLGRASALSAERLHRVDMAFVNVESLPGVLRFSSEQALVTASRLHPPPTPSHVPHSTCNVQRRFSVSYQDALCLLRAIIEGVD